MRTLSFAGYKKAVDCRLRWFASVGLDDLPSMPLRDWYNEGLRVLWATKRALRIAGLEKG